MRAARTAWTMERVARLGFLAGLGWDGYQVAIELSTSRVNLYRQAKRVGISFREAAQVRDGSAISLAARKRNLTPAALIAKMLKEMESYPTLIDNILDDS